MILISNLRQRSQCAVMRQKHKSCSGPCAEIVNRFQGDVLDTCREQRIAQLFNMDGTYVRFDKPPSYTINARGERSANIKTSSLNPKIGFSVTLLIENNGQKGKAHVTFSGLVPNGRVINDLKRRAPANVEVIKSV